MPSDALVSPRAAVSVPSARRRFLHALFALAATRCVSAESEFGGVLGDLLSLKLKHPTWTPDLGLLRQAWRELAARAAALAPTASRGSLAELLRQTGKLYTWQTWNCEYLDAEFWLDVCAANYALNAERAQRDSVAYRAAAYSHLSRALHRMAVRQPVRDPAAAFAHFRTFVPPQPDLSQWTPLAREWTVLWGDLHIHSALSYDAFLGPTHCYRFAREVLGFDFAALTDHAFYFGHARHPFFRASMDEMFGFVRDAATAHARAEDFATLLGIEWEGRFGQGHRHLLFDPATPPRGSYAVTRPDTNSIGRLWQVLAADGVCALTIAHHTGFVENSMGNDLLQHDVRFERLIEIASDNGMFESPGDAVPQTAGARVPAGRSVRDAFKRGHRLGIVGGSDGHMGVPGLYIPRVTGFGGAPGFTAVYARGRRAADIFEALQARRCYATDGQRIGLWFALNGAPMGSELTITVDTEQRIEIVVMAADKVAEVVLYNHDILVQRWHPRTTRFDTRWTVVGDVSRADRMATANASKRRSEAWRVVVSQTNGRRAWSSPIWVDYGV